MPPARRRPARTARRRTTRRCHAPALGTVLVVVVLTGLVACTDTSSSSTGSPGTSAGSAVDEEAVHGALDRESAMLGQAVQLGLTDVVTVLTTHVAALTDALPPTPTPSSSGPSSADVGPADVTSAAPDSGVSVPAVSPPATAGTVSSIAVTTSDQSSGQSSRMPSSSVSSTGTGSATALSSGASASGPPSVRVLHDQLLASVTSSLTDVPRVSDGSLAALLASVAASDAALAVTVNPRRQPASAQSAAAFGAAADVPLGVQPAPSGATPAPATASSDEVDAWQTALESEHAAVYGFGLVGGRLAATDEAARWSYDVHRARRDALADALTTAGATPSPAAAAYVPDTEVVTPRDARRLAAAIEEASLAAYTQVVAAGDAPWRRAAARWLQAATLSALGWSGTVTALPGMVMPQSSSASAAVPTSTP